MASERPAPGADYPGNEPPPHFIVSTGFQRNPHPVNYPFLLVASMTTNALTSTNLVTVTWR